MNQQELDLEKLSNEEIKQLWEKTRNEQRKQLGLREAQVRANADLGIEENYYIDNFGNAIEGVRPAPKTGGHYIDANGYVQDLANGERPPELSGNGLVDWLNNQDLSNDRELREALGEDALYLEEEIRVGDAATWLTGKLENSGWIITAQTKGAKDLKFRLARNLSRDEAVKQASTYLAVKSGPVYPALTAEQIRVCERLACTNRNAAFVYYLQSRLPVHIAAQFLQLSAEGDFLGVQELGATEKISEVAEDGVMNVFYFHNPRATEDFFDFARAHDGGRTWTFNLLDSLWQQYSLSTSLDRLAQDPQPTPEDLDAMSDEEVERTLLEARKLRLRS